MSTPEAGIQTVQAAEDAERDDANILVRLDDERPFFVKSGNDPLATKDVYLNFVVTEDGQDRTIKIALESIPEDL